MEKKWFKIFISILSIYFIVSIIVFPYLLDKKEKENAELKSTTKYQMEELRKVNCLGAEPQLYEDSDCVNLISDNTFNYWACNLNRLMDNTYLKFNYEGTNHPEVRLFGTSDYNTCAFSDQNDLEEIKIYNKTGCINLKNYPQIRIVCNRQEKIGLHSSSFFNNI